MMTLCGMLKYLLLYYLLISYFKLDDLVYLDKIDVGENRGISRILSRYNQNYVSLLGVYGTGLSGLNLHYSTI